MTLKLNDEFYALLNKVSVENQINFLWRDAKHTGHREVILRVPEMEVTQKALIIFEDLKGKTYKHKATKQIVCSSCHANAYWFEDDDCYRCVGKGCGKKWNINHELIKDKLTNAGDLL